MEKGFISTIQMQVEAVDVVKVLQCSKYYKEYIQAPETRGLFCSFEPCGQYVKKSGHIILEAFLAT